jgi:uncharacterized protein YjbI with pentapeptide repeats
LSRTPESSAATGTGSGSVPGPRPEPERRSSLRADCAECFGLCCVALPFHRSADFAVDKAGGEPCGHLRADFGCGIHARLREHGYRGCTVYDCFGAGQKVSQSTYGGRDWRRAPSGARQMFQVFFVMKQLHELLWYVDEALSLPEAQPVHDKLRAAWRHVDDLTRADADTLAELDVPAVRDDVGPLLKRASELVRSRIPGGLRGIRSRGRKSLDLMGADLKGADLHGTSLRNHLLTAADLRGADLRTVDLIGADLRDADLSGADLTGALYLTQPQLDAAKGDSATVLSGRAGLSRPPHW